MPIIDPLTAGIFSATGIILSAIWKFAPAPRDKLVERIAILEERDKSLGEKIDTLSSHVDKRLDEIFQLLRAPK